MNSNIFVKRLKVLYDHLLDDFYKGEDLTEDAKAITLLCHNFIELGKMSVKDDESNKH